MNKPKLNAPDETSEDFKNLVDLLSVYSEAQHCLDEMQANLNQQTLLVIDEYKKDYAEMQRTLTQAETALEIIAVRHPEWFTEKKSLKTPYGTVKFTRSEPLAISNEELSIELIERDAHGLGLDPENFIRERKELNREALETLPADKLKAFRIRREPRQNFSVVPAKIDLGKAVKEAAEKTEAA